MPAVSSGRAQLSLLGKYRQSVRTEMPAAAAMSSADVAATPLAANSRTASLAISSRVAALRRSVSGGRPALVADRSVGPSILQLLPP